MFIWPVFKIPLLSIVFTNHLILQLHVYLYFIFFTKFTLWPNYSLLTSFSVHLVYVASSVHIVYVDDIFYSNLLWISEILACFNSAGI